MSAANYQERPNAKATRMPEELVDIAMEVFMIPSTSYNEISMALYITRYINGLINDSISYEVDDYGNILITKGVGPYPCFCAHLDTVHTYSNGFNIECETLKNRDYLYAMDNFKKRVGIGGDDKCGIFVCLQLLSTLDDVKIVFFSQEESGGTGSSGVNLSFFEDCKFLGGIDRWNGKDFVNRYNGYHTISKSFNKTISGLLRQFGYDYNSGLFTDSFNVMERGLGLSCFNLSCGYYCHHTDKEYVDLGELYNSFLLCVKLGNLPGQYKFEIPPSERISYTKYHKFGSAISMPPYDSFNQATGHVETKIYDYVSGTYMWKSDLDKRQKSPVTDILPRSIYNDDSIHTYPTEVQYCKCCDLELLNWEKRKYKGYCATCWEYYRKDIDVMERMERDELGIS